VARTRRASSRDRLGPVARPLPRPSSGRAASRSYRPPSPLRDAWLVRDDGRLPVNPLADPDAVVRAVARRLTPGALPADMAPLVADRAMWMTLDALCRTCVVELLEAGHAAAVAWNEFSVRNTAEVDALLSIHALPTEMMRGAREAVIAARTTARAADMALEECRRRARPAFCFQPGAPLAPPPVARRDFHDPQHAGPPTSLLALLRRMCVGDDAVPLAALMGALVLVARALGSVAGLRWTSDNGEWFLAAAINVAVETVPRLGGPRPAMALQHAWSVAGLSSTGYEARGLAVGLYQLLEEGGFLVNDVDVVAMEWTLTQHTRQE